MYTQYESPPAFPSKPSWQKLDHHPRGRIKARSMITAKNASRQENPHIARARISVAGLQTARQKTPQPNTAIIPYIGKRLRVRRTFQRSSRSAVANKTPIAKASARNGVETYQAALECIHA